MRIALESNTDKAWQRPTTNPVSALLPDTSGEFKGGVKVIKTTKPGHVSALDSPVVSIVHLCIYYTPIQFFDS